MPKTWTFIPPLSLDTKKLILISIGALLFTSSFNSKAAQITLAWDNVNSDTIKGYVLYYGESSGNYTDSVDVGDKAIYTIDGLNFGKTYYFAAKAYNQNHSEFSQFSTEIKATLPDETATSQLNTQPNTLHDEASAQLSIPTEQLHNDGDTTQLNQQPPVVELGEIEVDHAWTQITFNESFSDPIVIAKPLSYNEADPAIINIRNVSPSGFEARIQEWDYLDGNHALEKIGYLAIERGTYTLPDGTRLEADQGDVSTGEGFVGFPFLQEYQTIPVVIASIYSDNSEIPLIPRLKDINIEGFQVFLQAGESQNHTALSSNETFSYIAWEPSSGITNGVAFEVNRTPNTIGQDFHPIKYQQSFIELPVFLADMQTANNKGAVNLRWRNKELLSVEIKVDKAKSPDNSGAEQAAESAGYALFGIASDNKKVVAEQ